MASMSNNGSAESASPDLKKSHGTGSELEIFDEQVKCNRDSVNWHLCYSDMSSPLLLKAQNVYFQVKISLFRYLYLVKELQPFSEPVKTQFFEARGTRECVPIQNGGR